MKGMQRMWVAFMLGIMLMPAVRVQAQADPVAADEAVNLFRDWRARRVSQILEDPQRHIDQLVHLVGYVGPQPDATAGRANLFILRGYEGGEIGVEFVGSRPLVNEHVYVLGYVKSTGVQPFITQARRYTMDSEQIRVWKDFDLEYAIENAFRTRMVGLQPLSRADWDERRRTTIREIEEFTARRARPAPAQPTVETPVVVTPPAPEPEPAPRPERGWAQILVWAGVAVVVILAIVVVAVVLLKPRARGGMEALPSSPAPQAPPPMAPQAAAPAPMAPAAPASASMPPPAEDDKTRVPERGTRALINGSPAAASDKTVVWRPGYLEVVEGSPRREKVRLDTETVLGRDFRSDKGDYRGYFVQLQMDDRPKEVRSQCSRNYAKIQYRSQDRAFVLSNITDNDNPITLNGKELISGEAETLKDGDEILLRPDWKFIFREGTPA